MPENRGGGRTSALLFWYLFTNCAGLKSNKKVKILIFKVAKNAVLVTIAPNTYQFLENISKHVDLPAKKLYDDSVTFVSHKVVLKSQITYPEQANPLRDGGAKSWICR